jgi:hypothetical protein
MKTRPAANRQLALITTIVLCGFALRIFRIEVQPYSGDEAFTIVNWARQPLSNVLTQIALIDPQPPGALLSLYGWTHLVGESELATRLLPALFSTLTLAVVYTIARLLFRGRAPLVAALLLSVSPYAIWHAQDLRSYSLWMGLSSLTTLLLLKAIKRPGHTKWWLAYAVMQAASLYTFYLEVFVLAAYHLFMLIRLRKNRGLLKPWLLSQGGVALLIGPWFLQPALRSAGYSPTAGAVNLPEAFSTLIFGETIPPMLNEPLFGISSNTFTISALLAIALIGAGTFFLIRSRNETAQSLLLTTAFVPITLLTLLTLVTQRGYFRARYVSASLIPLTIILAYLITRTAQPVSGRAPIRASLAGAITLIYAAHAFSSTWTYQFIEPKSPPWREIAAFLQDAAGPGDIIIRNYPDPAFEFYVSPSTDTIILPTEPLAPHEQTEQQARHLLSTYQYLWFLPVPSPAYDPEQFVAQELDSEAQQLSRRWFGPTQIMQYADWQVKPGEITNPLDAEFGDMATLTGYRTYPAPANWKPGTDLTLILFWEPHRQTEEPFIVRAHLAGPSASNEQNIASRDDGPPLDGNLSTTNWPTDQLIRDVRQLMIPPDAPAGAYTIAVSLHDLQTDASVPTQTGTEQVALLRFSLP